MRLTTPGRLLIESAIPDKYLSGVTTLTKKDLSKIFTRISQEEPEKYEDIMAKFTDVSRDVVYRQGREASVGLDDLTMSDKLRVYRDSVRKKLKEIQQNPYLKGAAKNKAIVDYLYKEMAVIPDRVVEDASARNSAFYAQVNSGARGNKSQLQQCVFGDGLLVDAENRPVPIPVTHSYAEGVQPMEFWAASSGARKGSIDVQFATADGGYLGKQLSNLGHRMIVTEKDCGTKQALSVDAQDLDNIGSVLAKTTNGVPAGTIITKDNIGKLGKGKILVRSVATCGCQDGICSVCAGVRERNSLPPIGDPIGIVAARAISEPITQSGLKCLHPDTLVRMADWSTKPLKDIQVGDFVLGADVNGICKPAKVTMVYDQGIQPMYVTTFRQGYSLKSTSSVISTTNHKFLLVTNKSSCKEEVYNAIPRILPVSHSGVKTAAMYPSEIKCLEGHVSEPAAFMLGLLCGDGCYTEKSGGKVHLSCADKTLIEFLNNDYLPAFNCSAVFHKGSECYWRISNNVSYNGENTQNVFKALLKKYGMFGKYAYEKTMPNNYLEWDNKSILDFISGIICADGHIRVASDGCRVMLGMTSKKLIEEISDLLFKVCGVLPPTIVTNSSGCHKRPLYVINYNRAFDVYRILTKLTLHGIKEKTKEAALHVLPSLMTNRFSGLSYGKRLTSSYYGETQALDIEVDNKDHLFVLANGLIVSNSKHTGGVAGMDDKKVHGFEELNQFIQVPNNFKGAATLSEIDGVVTSIKQAAAGGTYVTVNDKQFYVPRDSEVIVKKGDSVSAGDMLSDGTPNPGELIKYKGIGEGRKYFIEKYRDLLDKNGSSVHRRNIEAVARGFVNRIEISDIDGYNGYMINDVIPYDTFAFDYEPRENSKTLPPILSRDKFLEAPVLHYSIGTRITPAVIKELKANNIEKVTVNDKAPVFSPFIVRTKSLLQTDPDWQTALAGENLKKTLLQSARLGGTSTPEGTSYFPAMANPTTVDLYKGGDQNKPLIQENYVKVT